MNRSPAKPWVIIAAISTLLNFVLACLLFASKPNPKIAGTRTRSPGIAAQNTPAVKSSGPATAAAAVIRDSEAKDKGLRADLMNIKGRFLILDKDLKLSRAFATACGLDSKGASRMEAMFKKLYSRQLEMEKQQAQIKTEADGGSYYHIPPYATALETEVAELTSTMVELAGPAPVADLEALMRADYRHGGMFRDQEISLELAEGMLPNIRLYWKYPAGIYWSEDIAVDPLGPNEKYSHRIVDRYSHIIDFESLLKPYVHRTNSP